MRREPRAERAVGSILLLGKDFGLLCALCATVVNHRNPILDLIETRLLARGSRWSRQGPRPSTRSITLFRALS
jgi:hypothetical protein